MKAFLVATAVAAAVLTAPGPAHAQISTHAQWLVTPGRCHLATATDPTIEDGTVQTGQIAGGPLDGVTVTKSASAWSATVSIRCSVHVGAANSLHSGAPAAWTESVPWVGAATLPPTFVSYQTYDDWPVFVCTRATVNDVNYHYDAWTHEWTTSTAALCEQVIDHEVLPGVLEPVLALVDEVLARLDGVDPLAPQCSDGLDNDLDGDTDYSADPDCASPSDSSEAAGGPPGVPSASCDAGQQVHDGTVAGVYLKLYVAQPAPDRVDVCFRVASTGGRISVTAAAPGATVGVPSVDGNAAACAATDPPNTLPGPHPVAGGSLLGTPYLVDTYRGGDEVSVCLVVGTTLVHRVLVPVTPPDVDPGTPVSYEFDPA